MAAMAMIVRVGMPMRMGMYVIAMAVRMITLTVIGARFRMKRRCHAVDRKTEAAHHVIEHMIVLPGELAGRNLQHHVTIAQMIGGAHQLEMIMAFNNRQLFRRGIDANAAAVIGQQHVAVFQYRATRQKKTQYGATARRDFLAAFLPLVVNQIDDIVRFRAGCDAKLQFVYFAHL
jgi:hypothetical protein